jgi:hypothetical protein
MYSNESKHITVSHFIHLLLIIYFKWYNANKQINVYSPYCFCNITKCVHCSSSDCLFVSFKQLKKLKTYTHPLSSRYIFWTSVSDTANQIYTVLLDLNKKWIYQTSCKTNTDGTIPLATHTSLQRGHKGWKTPHGSTKNFNWHMNRLKCLFQKEVVWTKHTSVLICTRLTIFNYMYCACSNNHKYKDRNWEDWRK